MPKPIRPSTEELVQISFARLAKAHATGDAFQINVHSDIAQWCADQYRLERLRVQRATERLLYKP